MTDEHWTRDDTERGEPVTITVDGVRVRARRGETVAAAMLAAGTDFDCDRDGNARAPFCNMGTCFECVATVDGRRLTRTCLVSAEDGARIDTERRL